MIFVVLSMFFCHVFDDYTLQGIMANLKQKSWWEKNAPDKKYKYDYIPALICHSFSWSFMIMLPIAFYYHFNLDWMFVFYIVINTAIHAVTDDLKANKLKINLIVDQSIHALQIILTAIAFLVR